MIGKVFALVIALMLLVFSLGYLYQVMPGEPVVLETIPIDGGSEIVFDYGATPVFSENLRFDHNLISYYIESDCPAERRRRMIGAFAIFQEEMESVSFYERSKEEADILIGCSQDYIKTGEDVFIAGEGGPSRYLNTDNFDIILEGKVLLYRDSECEYPVVEVHELLHVFGFNHINNPKSLMYNVSACDQRFTPDMAELIKSLYAVEPLPDFYLSNVSGTRKGKYLDFELTVKNGGLIGSDKAMLDVVASGKVVDSFEVNAISVGSGRVLRVTNAQLPSRSISEVSFIIDRDNKIREVKEDNNEAKLVVSG
jgi:hypothetical protein